MGGPIASRFPARVVATTSVCARTAKKGSGIRKQKKVFVNGSSSNKIEKEVYYTIRTEKNRYVRMCSDNGNVKLGLHINEEATTKCGKFLITLTKGIFRIEAACNSKGTCTDKAVPADKKYLSICKTEESVSVSAAATDPAAEDCTQLVIERAPNC